MWEYRYNNKSIPEMQCYKTSNNIIKINNQLVEETSKLNILIDKFDKITSHIKDLKIDVMLQNNSDTEIQGIIQSSSRFIIQIDNHFYVKDDFGGKATYMPAGKKTEPVILDMKNFYDITDSMESPFLQIEDYNSDEKIIILYYKLNGKLIKSKEYKLQIK